MTQKILFVDDEPNILAALKRQLSRMYKIDTAVGAEEGLAAVRNQGPYAVVVSDLRMPGMDGIQFLAAVHDRTPETVRVMLSGHADLEAAIGAVNEGNIFRFLMKPVNQDTLSKALDAALQQYHLVVAERELLQMTLRECVMALSSMLSIASPIAYNRALRVTRYVKAIVSHLMVPNAGQYELAALLSQIGCIAIPSDVLEKMHYGDELNRDERIMFSQHPAIGHDLLVDIPRLDSVAKMIARQPDPFHWSTPSELEERIVPDLGTHVLGVALDFDSMITHGATPNEAICQLKEDSRHYHPAIIGALENLDLESSLDAKETVSVEDLKVGMILAQELRTHAGKLLAIEGQELTLPVLDHIRFWSERLEVCKDVQIYMPQMLVEEPIH